MKNVIEKKMFKRRKEIDKIDRIRLRECMIKGLEEKKIYEIRMKDRFKIEVEKVKEKKIVELINEKKMSKIMGRMRKGIEGEKGKKIVLKVKYMNYVIRENGE